jgi:CubicO group peptidase (beta-lactamase class C family)
MRVRLPSDESGFGAIRQERRLIVAVSIVFAIVLASIALARTSDEADRSDGLDQALPALVPLPDQPKGVPWPNPTWPEAAPSAGVDNEILADAADALFEWVGRGAVPDTRALIVVQHGRIVFERYADGFGPDSRFHTWSMAKSYTQALAGILVGRGMLSLDERAPIPEWQSEGDPRRDITLRHLLNMTSGIDNGDFGGDDDGAGDVVAQLLFGAGASDLTAFAANHSAIHPPGSHWAYSTATSTLVAGIIGRAVGADAAERRAFIRAELLEPIGAANTVFEFDRAGHFLGGSHIYATARDFARFGLLYLRDGVWDQRRILPEGWVDFARTHAPAANNGTYGAHFWINLEPKKNQFVLLPGAPTSVFEASGNAGQYVIIAPTHDVLIIRLGEMQATNWNELNGRLARLLEAFPETGS